MAGDMAGAIGDIGMGALIAREVDTAPAASAGAVHAGDLCLNCGTRLTGAHCHACGQAGHVHRTLGAIGHDIAHGVFHFEGRMWRTLPMLVLRPGELTRRYVAGERVRFVAPLALFLFTVFLMFAVVASLPAWHLGDGVKGASAARLADALAEERRAADASLAEATRDLAAEQREERPSARRIARLRTRIDDARRTGRQLAGIRAALPAADPATVTIRSRSSWLDEDYVQAKYEAAKANPELLIYKLKSSAYKFSWALIPLSTPFVALLFLWRRRFGLYDHAVFVTYSLTFMSLLVIALTLLSAAGTAPGWIAMAALVLPPFHMYRQLRGAYGVSRFGGLWRSAALLLFAGFILLGFALALLFNGLSH